jgi:hypothetical protein
MVSFTLSGYLGGYQEQADQATLVIKFLGDANTFLGQSAIGPVVPGERDFQTQLVLRSSSGKVPVGTLRITLMLLMTKPDINYNDGYADNLSDLAPLMPGLSQRRSHRAGLASTVTFLRPRRASIREKRSFPMHEPLTATPKLVPVPGVKQPPDQCLSHVSAPCLLRSARAVRTGTLHPETLVCLYALCQFPFRGRTAPVHWPCFCPAGGTSGAGEGAQRSALRPLPGQRVEPQIRLALQPRPKADDTAPASRADGTTTTVGA